MHKIVSLVEYSFAVWLLLVVTGYVLMILFRRPLRKRWLTTAALVGLGGGIYESFNVSRPARDVAGPAHANAAALLRLEHAVGVGGSERAINHAVASVPALGSALGAFYGSAHLIVTFFLVCWLGASGHRVWRWAFPALALTFVVAISVFAVHPVAPPWAMVGFHALSGGLESGSAPAALEFAAFPSLHVAFAVWAGIVGWKAWPRFRFVAAAYPLLVSFAVVATANHYLIDCVAGAALCLVAVSVSALACRVVDRCRRSVELPIDETVPGVPVGAAAG